MFANVVLGTNDLIAAKAFYDAALATLNISEEFFNKKTTNLIQNRWWLVSSSKAN